MFERSLDKQSKRSHAGLRAPFCYLAAFYEIYFENKKHEFLFLWKIGAVKKITLKGRFLT